ncbi:MAG: hypothetical protein V4585_04990 [Bacteroidota bacterium]|jgi:hypothetical protein
MEAIDHIKDKAEDIFDNASDYLEARWNLGVLNTSSKIAESISVITITLIIASISLIALLFLSLSVAWVIGEYLGSPALGFFYVGVFYFVIGIMVYFIKDKYIKLPIINSFIKKFYYED